MALCKIAGAHAADGSLSNNYGIRLMDSSKVSVTKWAGWFKEEFDINLAVRKSKKENAFKTEKYNKVIARYLNVFFEFPFGKKSDIVKEPQLIKTAAKDFRKAFALGVLTFDGSVSLEGSVTIDSNSLQLLKDIQSILAEGCINSIISASAGIKHVLRVANSKSHFNFKLLDYFEKETPKHTRLKFISGLDFKSHFIGDTFNEIFPNSHYSLTDLVVCCAKLKIFDWETIMATLGEKNYFRFFIYKDFLLRYNILYSKNRLTFDEFKSIHYC
ncbi:MAG: hypothetical protein PHD95_05945 [Candidatus ainarchaeum sp.]|nr:hypothetical protein [Candidatus ainarchaeum sp.]